MAIIDRETGIHFQERAGPIVVFLKMCMYEVAQLFEHCATGRKVAGSIPDVVSK